LPCGWIVKGMVPGKKMGRFSEEAARAARRLTDDLVRS
jgi:hypothetical protein